MDDGIPDTRSLESIDNFGKELAVHPHGVGLSVRPIQMGLVANVPVTSLFDENEPSGLVGRNPRHCRRCLMSSSHLKMAVCLTEGIRFIEGEEPHLSRSLIDNPNAKVPWVLSHLLLDMGNLGGITGCVYAHKAKLHSWLPTKYYLPIPAGLSRRALKPAGSRAVLTQMHPYPFFSFFCSSCTYFLNASIWYERNRKA